MVDKTKNLERMKNYDLCLEVYADYASSGVWLIRKEGGRPNIGDLKSLGIPTELVRDFARWQAIYDHAELFVPPQTPLEKELDSWFDRFGLDLAKRLKAHFKDKAYVEYQNQEIFYFCVMNDSGECYLWEEDGCGMDATCFEECLGVEFDAKTKQGLENLHQKLNDWSDECWIEIDWPAIEKREIDETKRAELLKRGSDLTQKLREILPAYCVIEFEWYA